MKNPWLLALLCLIFLIDNSNARAQGSSNSVSIGFELDRYHNEFGYGLNVSSPFFANDSVAIRGAATQAFYEGTVDEETGEQKWTGFGVYKLGVVGGRIVRGFMRMYGFGGLAYVTPAKKFSDKSSVTGGFGGFGFEFISDRDLNYFIELGSIGTGARADKLPGKPIYANGFLQTVGFRYYL